MIDASTLKPRTVSSKTWTGTERHQSLTDGSL